MSPFKKLLVIALLTLVYLNPALALAQTTATTAELPKYDAGVDSTIEQYLCTPEGNGKDLENCINRLYRFGITAGAVVLIFMVVIAGYIYISSGEAGKGKAKSLVLNSIVGMGVLLGSYILLYFINPNLTIIKSIQPPIFTAPEFPSCDEVGLGEDCTTADGGVSFGGMDCTMPLADSVVKGFNNSVHNPWDEDPGTPDKHRTVRKPPNGPAPQGAVDLVVSKPAVPIYSPVSGKVDKLGDLGRVGKYITISSDLKGEGCDRASACASLAHIEPSVQKGDMVKAGQQVGVSTVYEGGLGPHLHLELKLGGQWVLGDGKKGTWDNMKAAISKCSSKSSGTAGGIPKGFVNIKDYAPDIVVDMRYATVNNFTGKVASNIKDCYVASKEVAEGLKKASDSLKSKKLKLRVWDCYRPKEVQQFLWDNYKGPEPKTKYVADPAKGSRHTDGKAVDITIDGLNMQSDFDDFGNKASVNYSASKDQKQNLGALQSAMKAGGFEVYPSEWWHFTFKGPISKGSEMAALFPPSSEPADGEGVGGSPPPDPKGEGILCKLADGQTPYNLFGLKLLKVASAARKCYYSYYTGGSSDFSYHYRQDSYTTLRYGECTGPKATLADDGCGVISTAMVLNWIYHKHDGKNNVAPQFQGKDFLTGEGLAELFVESGYRICGKGSKWDSPYKVVSSIFPFYDVGYKRYADPNGGIGYLNKSESQKKEILSNLDYTVKHQNGIAIALVGGGAPWNVDGHFVVVHTLAENYDNTNLNFYKIADPWGKSDVTLIEKDRLVKLIKAISYFNHD